jgi:hypothetical protein
MTKIALYSILIGLPLAGLIASVNDGATTALQDQPISAIQVENTQRTVTEVPPIEPSQTSSVTPGEDQEYAHIQKWLADYKRTHVQPPQEPRQTWYDAYPPPPRTVVYPDTFHGYDCTDDCSGHEAGYQWAEDNGISDTSDCDQESQSFAEGCQAYVEENY